MITIQTNIAEIVGGITSKIEGIVNDSDNSVIRAVAVAMLPVIHDRIHVEGLDANGSPIGNYSPGYMKVRTNSGFKSKTIARGPSKGSPRPNYNRSGDTKVILSLTRQMENDFSVVATQKGYGLGFKNAVNFDKATWSEQTYGKKIYGLTPGEQDTVVEIATEQIINALRS